ncbi:CAP domain-containing protein [Flavobacterium sp. LS2P90]|uniref:CAP domain-containing protein n=1 Tax=Flavobacterium xylosi TaxID=3230415 RepID=A0ABW6HVX3_9FLAO
MDLINTYRISVGLKALIKTNYISYKAEDHNKYMIANNVINHDGFDARYIDIKNVLRATGMGENVAFNYISAKAVVDGWLASPGHKANILGNFTHFGISVRPDSAGKKYYTNIFVKI